MPIIIKIMKRLELLNNNAKFSPVIKIIYLHQIIGHDKAMCESPLEDKLIFDQVESFFFVCIDLYYLGPGMYFGYKKFERYVSLSKEQIRVKKKDILFFNRLKKKKKLYKKVLCRRFVSFRFTKIKYKNNLKRAMQHILIAFFMSSITVCCNCYCITYSIYFMQILLSEEGSDFSLSIWLPLTKGTSATSFSISDVFKPSGGSACTTSGSTGWTGAGVSTIVGVGAAGVASTGGGLLVSGSFSSTTVVGSSVTFGTSTADSGSVLATSFTSEVTRDKLNRTRHCCLAMVDIIFIAPYKAMDIMEGRYDDETYCLQLGVRHPFNTIRMSINLKKILKIINLQLYGDFNTYNELNILYNINNSKCITNKSILLTETNPFRILKPKHFYRPKRIMICMLIRLYHNIFLKYVNPMTLTKKDNYEIILVIYKIWLKVIKGIRLHFIRTISIDSNHLKPISYEITGLKSLHLTNIYSVENKQILDRYIINHLFWFMILYEPPLG
ncbi:hypothetical protein AGLY_011690 [Aphis glycines]|uniref:Uncharacterized protein n=1 Tax=Aphis glycines TaxID=307491 RepID=A0A6G0TD24_APHGL|nr:hypothetical protein AGLY_011690 [Aphis glycines]